MWSGNCVKKPCHDCPFRTDVRFMPLQLALRNVAIVKSGDMIHHCHNTTEIGREPLHCAGFLLVSELWGVANTLLVSAGGCEALGISAGVAPLYQSPEDLLSRGVVYSPTDFLPPSPDDSKISYLSAYIAEWNGTRWEDLLSAYRRQHL